MNTLFVILCMIFMHVIADYNLQGWLASAKQKSYWQENAPDKLYKYDYIMALIMHSISYECACAVDKCLQNSYLSIDIA